MEVNEALVREIIYQILKEQEKEKDTYDPSKYLASEQTTKVLFGVGYLNIIGHKVKEFGCHKVMLVTDPGIVKLGLSDKVKELIEKQGIKVVIFDQVHPNPVDSDCNAGGKFAVEHGVDGIVALGGGSVMDSGKAIKILTKNPMPISNYYGTMDYKQGVPLILIPTTAGTGSEVTKYAVITDGVTHAKKVALGTGDLAICDPEITYNLPKGLTAATGMDVMAHACESLAGGIHNPKADILAKEAIAKITEWLPKAFDGIENEKARFEVMLSCNLAGMAFNETLCHLGHATAHSIGAKFGIPHGICCAWALPETMVYCAGLFPERVRMIADAMGLSYNASISAEGIGKLVADHIRSIMRHLQIKSLKESGITREDIINISNMIMTDFCYPIIPTKLTEGEIKEFLGRVYDSYQ